MNLHAGETLTLTPLCHSGDVVIGGWTNAQGVENLTGDKRFAEIGVDGAPARQGWTATATRPLISLEPSNYLLVKAVCLHLG
jgi:hypothetical protein